jgi:hypothetical protein
MSALPAFSASSRRIGSARALSACVCVSLPVRDSVRTSISLPCSTVAWTWMEENGVVTSGPFAVTEPGGCGRGVGVAAPRRGAGVRSADSGLARVGGRVS